VSKLSAAGLCYDEPGGKTRLFKRKRQAEMAQLFIKEGKNIRELAKSIK